MHRSMAAMCFRKVIPIRGVHIISVETLLQAENSNPSSLKGKPSLHFDTNHEPLNMITVQQWRGHVVDEAGNN